MISRTKISSILGFAPLSFAVIFLIAVEAEFLLANEAKGTDAADASGEVTGMPFDEVPFHSEWVHSPHADVTAEAFTHWNKEGEIPAACASCHSTPGFLDYLEAGNAAPGSLRAVTIGTVITCMACHNNAARKQSSVVFPSGLKVDVRGGDARCMHCHGGVQSTAGVNEAIRGLPEDEVVTQLSFINVHYRAAAATMMGHEAQVAYEYPGQIYAGRHDHSAPSNGCTTCHDPHTTEIKVMECAACHAEVKDRASLRLISNRKAAGYGSSREPIALTIEHLHQQLMLAIQSYAASISGKPIAYSAGTYPYFFVDTNANGAADDKEAVFGNKYNAWTPRLLKAAYNYQFIEKDPGAYAHNPDYASQILYDSLRDLAVKVKTDLGEFKRP